MNDPKDAKADSSEDSVSVSGAEPTKAKVDGVLYHTTQPCDQCGQPVPVNAVSPSECFCSAECMDQWYDALGDE